MSRLHPTSIHAGDRAGAAARDALRPIPDPPGIGLLRSRDVMAYFPALARRNLPVPGYFAFRRTPSGEFMFTLTTVNHQVILTSPCYASRQAALDGIESVRYNSQVAIRFERRAANDGGAYFVLYATDGRIIGMSEMFADVQSLERGIRAVMEHGATRVIRQSD